MDGVSSVQGLELPSQQLVGALERPRHQRHTRGGIRRPGWQACRRHHRRRPQSPDLGSGHQLRIESIHRALKRFGGFDRR